VKNSAKEGHEITNKSSLLYSITAGEIIAFATYEFEKYMHSLCLSSFRQNVRFFVKGMKNDESYINKINKLRYKKEFVNIFI
jgi:hypothetical protein